MDSVVGLDLSLTSTGMAVARQEEGVPTVFRIKSKPTTAYLRDRLTRHYLILAQILENLTEIPTLAVIEQPAFSKTTGHMHDRSGLWWFIVTHFLQEQCSVVEVPPTTLKRYVVGKGNAAKDEMLAATIRRYTQVNITGNDEADALGLAAMGARHCGWPIDDLPKAHLTAMEKVMWPALTTLTAVS